MRSLGLPGGVGEVDGNDTGETKEESVCNDGEGWADCVVLSVPGWSMMEVTSFVTVTVVVGTVPPGQTVHAAGVLSAGVLGDGCEMIKKGVLLMTVDDAATSFAVFSDAVE